MSPPQIPPEQNLSESKRQLLEKLMRGSASRSARASELIMRRPSEVPAPLGLAQEQVWRRSLRAARKPPLYNEVITVYRDGPLDVCVLERCLAEIIRRHEAWRSSFDTLNGQPIQLIHSAPGEIKIPFDDLEVWPDNQRESKALELMSDRAQQPFDLKQSSLLRLFLLKMGANAYRLAIIAHQSIIDGVSVYQVFPSELTALYEAFSTGKPSPLPEPQLQYSDFAYWHRGWLREEIREQQIAYWRKQLAGEIPRLNWPGRLVSAKDESFRGVIKPFVLPIELGRRVKEFSHEHGTTLFQVLLTAFTALIYCYAQQDDILIGTLSPAGRKRSEVQALLGYFLNPVALRYRLSREVTFGELLQESRRLLSEAISNDDVPLEVVAEELKLSSDRDPFVKIALSLQPYVPTVKEGWDVTSMDAQSGGTVWDLYLAFIDGTQGLVGRAQYNPDIFQQAMIFSMLDDLWNVLSAGTADPARRVKDLL
jgi:Condensation domain